MTKPLQYCKVISLQLIKINGKKNKAQHSKKLKKKQNNIFLKINTRYVHIHKKQGYI